MRKALIALVLVGGCAADQPPPITIDQGVYGILSVSSDVGGQPDGVFPNVSVAAYRAGTIAGSTTSDSRGAYELALEPGTYVICTLDADPQTLADQWQHNCAGKCTQLEVSVGIVQADWAANLSGGWWEVGEHCPR